MTKKSSSKAASKPKANESAEHYHNDLIKRIAELEAEVASLKKQSSSQSPGGEDPRVNAIVAYLKLRKSSDKNRSAKLAKILSSL